MKYKRPIRKIKPGGFRGYIPKILVTGPFHAGKTTMVHSLSMRAVSVQRMGTTVALDFGHVDYKGFSLDLFGTIGQPRFDPILTVSDVEGFTHRGGMINLLTSGRKIRIEINVEEAKKFGFDISAKLLKLAHIVNGGKDK